MVSVRVQCEFFTSAFLQRMCLGNIAVGPMPSPCPDKSYHGHSRVCPGGQTPVEAYIGIKQAYQGILGEYLAGWAYQALTRTQDIPLPR